MDKESRSDVLKRTILLVADRATLIEMIARANQPANKWLRDLMPGNDLGAALPDNKWLLAGVGAISLVGFAPMVATVGAVALAGAMGKGIDSNRGKVSDHQIAESDDALLAQLNEAIKLPLPVVRMTAASAMEAFDFGDIPMPKNGEFYLRHPVWENQYVPALEYPHRLIREKHAAFMKLAGALGAQSVTLRSVKLNGVSGGLSLQAPLEQIAGSLSVNAKFDKSGAVVESFTEVFAKPARAAFVPHELERWVRSDTQLERMRFNRMEARALKSSISISTTSKLGLDAGVLAKVAEVDVDASANYLAAATSVWEFEVTYHDLE